VKSKVRKITVNNDIFKWLVIEDWLKSDNVKLRCYSTVSSYLEVRFPYEIHHFANVYKPKVVSLFIKYALESGWNYTQNAQIYKIPVEDSMGIAKKLGMDLLPFN